MGSASVTNSPKYRMEITMSEMTYTEFCNPLLVKLAHSFCFVCTDNYKLDPENTLPEVWFGVLRKCRHGNVESMLVQSILAPFVVCGAGSKLQVLQKLSRSGKEEKTWEERQHRRKQRAVQTAN